MTEAHRSKHHENLYAYDNSPYWVYRRYSSEKRKQFNFTTGIPKTDKLAAAAHKVGRDAYNEWLGRFLPSGRTLYIRDLGEAVKKRLKAGKSKNHYRSIKGQLDNHVIPHFGHLRPDQVTAGTWSDYETAERARGERKALFNTRKALVMCLSYAKAHRLIKELPELDLNDPESAPPVHIPPEDYRTIRRALPNNIKLMAFWMYWMGPRPHEVLAYRWSMIDLGSGPTGKIAIPREITKTRRARAIPIERHVYRALRRLKPHRQGDALLPGEDKDTPITEYNAVWSRTLDRLSEAGQDFEYTAYNLRDTFITNALRRGISSVFVGKYCDTSATMIERKYAVATDEIMQEIANGSR